MLEFSNKNDIYMKYLHFRQTALIILASLLLEAPLCTAQVLPELKTTQQRLGTSIQRG